MERWGTCCVLKGPDVNNLALSVDFGNVIFSRKVNIIPKIKLKVPDPDFIDTIFEAVLDEVLRFKEEHSIVLKNYLALLSFEDLLLDLFNSHSFVTVLSLGLIIFTNELFSALKWVHQYNISFVINEIRLIYFVF